MNVTQKSAMALNTTATILVVEDNSLSAQSFYELFRQAGYSVILARSGRAALEHIKAYTPDLIVLDAVMPGLDGFETCRQLKASKHSQDIPVMLVSVLNDIDSRVNGLSAGACDFVSKPYQENELLVRINAHLNHARTVQSLRQQVKQLSSQLNWMLENFAPGPKSDQSQLSLDQDRS
jgi:two-component system, NtrC family, sensor kinase